MWQTCKNVYHGFTAFLAALYYGYPGRRIKVIGVTGTDGKTTTTHLIHHILKAAGKKVSMVSSVYAEIAGKKYDTGFHVTTPDSWMLQKFFKEAVDRGDEYMVLEVTSHGLDQNRVGGIAFEAGVLTNITHEHLDYHKTYEQYVRAKLKLLFRSRVAIVNKDDESYKQIIEAGLQPLTYGIKQAADTTPKNFSFTSPLPGEYNRYNCLAAIAVSRVFQIDTTIIQAALKKFPGVKGRFEYFQTHKDFGVIIDFAHTPNALEKVLSTVKPSVSGKLIHVFGAAGLRDFTKRPVMGKVSATYADVIVLTEEDYRTESVEEIIETIAQGCRDTGAKEYETIQVKKALQENSAVFFKISDRKTAIEFAIRKLARKGDMVILTGKAHEKSLCRGTTEHPWSEHGAVHEALKKV